MTDLFANYKKCINSLDVPDYSIEELRNHEQHKKYTKRKKKQGLMSILLLTFIIGAMVSITAYAAYTLHKNMKFTTQGIKIDVSDLNDTQGDRLLHEYGTDSLASDKEMFVCGQDAFALEKNIDICYFDTWEEALKVLDVPIVYPENMQYSELKITGQKAESFALIEASYVIPKRQLVISYTFFTNFNWDLAIHYNAAITNQRLYTNKYHYSFWITECQYDNDKQTNVSTYMNNCVIQLSFSGYEDNEIYHVLDEFNLSTYE